MIIAFVGNPNVDPTRVKVNLKCLRRCADALDKIKKRISLKRNLAIFSFDLKQWGYLHCIYEAWLDHPYYKISNET